MSRIRRETPGDEDAVREVNEQAFGQPDEARLVDRLRGSADPYLSLVAEDDGVIVGHVLFTRVTVRDGSTVSDAIGLAPLAVRPSHQRRGIGAALSRAGLDACRELGHDVVFVLGDPAYYGRFGFTLAAPLGLRYTAPNCEAAFQVLELEEGALGGRTGVVEYLPPFADTDT